MVPSIPNKLYCTISPVPLLLCVFPSPSECEIRSDKSPFPTNGGQNIRHTALPDQSAVSQCVCATIHSCDVTRAFVRPLSFATLCPISILFSPVPSIACIESTSSCIPLLSLPLSLLSSLHFCIIYLGEEEGEMEESLAPPPPSPETGSSIHAPSDPRNVVPAARVVVHTYTVV